MMKKITSLFLLCSTILFGQTKPGDMAFIAFNADADDDFAMVTFVDIAANTTIYFTDSEWDGTQFGTDENDFSWESGNSLIPAGTVITFNTISGTPSTSIGSISGTPGGVSGSSEAIFAFIGTAPRTPTTFIAAVANSDAAYGTLTGTGLYEGTTAITYTPNGIDIAEYKGVRTGLDINGFLIALNNMTNYNFQDDSGDQNNDAIAPDVPFNTGVFSISNTDTTPPSVLDTKIVNNTTLDVVFSENVTTATAENSANYIINNGVTISAINYNSSNATATITHSGFTSGTAYTITIDNVEDDAANMINSTYSNSELFYNNTTDGLIITEIMYNAPSSDSNKLEFIEIYNNTNSTIELGGIRVKDEGNFVYRFPEMSLNTNSTVLLATDKTAADAFYGVSFLDLPQGISNALGNGGEILEILNTENTQIFSVEYSDDAPWPTAADGTGPSLELLNPANSSNSGTNWAAATNLVGVSITDNVYASPGSFIPVIVATPQVSFVETVLNINESDTTIDVEIELTTAHANDITVDISLLTSFNTATAVQDFDFVNQTVTILKNTTSVTLQIPIIDDADIETDEMFTIELSNPTNATLGANTITGIYIIDNDRILEYPSAPNVEINYETSFLVDDNGSAEISAYNADNQILYVLNSTESAIEFLDFSDLTNITSTKTVDLSTYGTDGATSVAYNNGMIVVSLSNGPIANGTVVMMDKDGLNISTVTVGNLPDNISFTPDGMKVLTANEGQPNDDYSIDPEGSISIIDVNQGLGNIIQSHVNTIDFNAFDSQVTTLRNAGVRITGPTGTTVSQDVEPEYIAYSNDSKTAWVSLQENNALAVVDLTSEMITDILPLGYKDHNLTENSLDVSDKTDFIFMANWPIKGMYMPDAIAQYEINGVPYIITANEGDSREYDTYEDEIKLGDSDFKLDPTIFPNADLLKLENNLGRLIVTNANGNTDADEEFEEVYSFGTRSFSIRNGNTGALVYDSGDDFERYTAADETYGVLFNTSNSKNEFKDRSDAKGPEPEGVTTATINGKSYAFITLERVGGFMTYDVTDPMNPVFIKYMNNRDLGNDEGGDLGPEGIIYIAPEDSSNGKGLIVMSNEVSATISIYSITDSTLENTKTNLLNDNEPLKVYPNPIENNEVLNFNKVITAKLYDLTGRTLLNIDHTNQLNIATLNTGTYILKTIDNETSIIIVK